MTDIETLAKRIILIGKGQILYDGSLNKLKSKYGSYKKYLAQGNTATSWYYGNKVVAARDRLIANGGL